MGGGYLVYDFRQVEKAISFGMSEQRRTYDADSHVGV